MESEACRTEMAEAIGGADRSPGGSRESDPRDNGQPHPEASAAQVAKNGDVLIDRRGFLKATGFTLTGAMAAGCHRAPVEKAIPFLIQPEEVVPGQSLWYASTCGGCTAGCGVLVKCRDGRPIKIEGNREQPMSAGGLCATGQAAILSLYDSQRLAAPLLRGQPADWQSVDLEIRQQLEEIAARGGRIRLLTETVNGPTELASIERFLGRFENARHVVYDPLSSSAIATAHELTHGAALVPRYRFDRARVIASFDADFLGTWLSPVEHSNGYRFGRDLEGEPPRLSHHSQFEGRMSLTGSNADHRTTMRPEAIGPVLTALVSLLAERAGVANQSLTLPAVDSSVIESALGRSGVVDELAERLWNARGHALVVCGSQQVGAQVLVNFANHLLGSEGETLDLEQPSFQRQGDDRALAGLVAELEAGSVDALLVRGVNPVYDLPTGAHLVDALARTPLVVSFASHRDETALASTLVCPDHHGLESWRDAEPVAGLISLTQPTIRPLGQTRGFAESLASWIGEPADALTFVRATWESAVYPRRVAMRDTLFDEFWDRSVHDGFASVEPRSVATTEFGLTSAALEAVSEVVTPRPALAGEAPFTLVLYPKVALRDGRHAENPFLQELPDPITKVVWDNYAALSPRAADELGVTQGDVVRLQVDDHDPGPAIALELPVLIQPGQHDGVVAVAVGYGREGTSRFVDVGPRWLQGRRTVASDETVGRSAAPLATSAGGQRLDHRIGVRVEPTGAVRPLALTQTYHSLTMPAALTPSSGEPRPIVQETMLAAYAADQSAGAPHGHHVAGDLWPEHAYDTYHWGMSIDLNACTGCSACVVACQVENNVPVVGKDEVARRRDMHWLRIDRYYAEDADAVDVAHQPMTCHHCDNAPCETVCPVLATVHSDEGLNQQIYNRCVGTRYCANNCPFKVRRFNWFDYPHEERMENLLLNPDVVVRSRGVMEKCSFCVQRIQEAKHAARVDGREVVDGEIQTACEQSCPTRAITFGDLGDPASRVAKSAANPRQYRLFEELNIRPSLGYLRRVRNRAGRHEADHG